MGSFGIMRNFAGNALEKNGVERFLGDGRNGVSTDTKLKKTVKRGREKRRNVVEYWGMGKWIITELPLYSDGNNGH